MDAEPNDMLPIRTIHPPKKLGNATQEYDVYSIKSMTVDADKVVNDSKDIVYKEFKMPDEDVPNGQSLEKYAIGLKKLSDLVHRYYPEAVQTDYIIAQNSEKKPAIIAIQPMLKDRTAHVAGLIDPSLINEIKIKEDEFKARWNQVVNDQEWSELPTYITDTRTVPDFNSNNFTRSQDGQYHIFDW